MAYVMLSFLKSLPIDLILTLIWLVLFFVWGISEPKTWLRRLFSLACFIFPFALISLVIINSSYIIGIFFLIVIGIPTLLQSLIYAAAAIPAIMFWRFSKKDRIASYVTAFLCLSFIGMLAFGAPALINWKIANALEPSIPEISMPIPQKPRSIAIVKYITSYMDTGVYCGIACMKLLYSGEVDEVFSATNSLNKNIISESPVRYTLQKHLSCAYEATDMPEEIKKLGIVSNEVCPQGEPVPNTPPVILVSTLDSQIDESRSRLYRERSVRDARESPSKTLWYQSDIALPFAIYPLQFAAVSWRVIVRKEYPDSGGTDALHLETILKQKLGYSLKPLPKYLTRETP